jgi:hypothetical protein
MPGLAEGRERDDRRRGALGGRELAAAGPQRGLGDELERAEAERFEPVPILDDPRGVLARQEPARRCAV